MNAVVQLNPLKRAPVKFVEADQLGKVWPTVSQWIEAALEHGQGDENVTDVLIACARNQYGLATDGESMACVFQYVKYPQQSVVTLIYAGGSLDACYRAFEWAKEYFKAHNVDVLRIWGRAGWEKTLGLERIGTIMQVKL